MMSEEEGLVNDMMRSFIGSKNKGGKMKISTGVEGP